MDRDLQTLEKLQEIAVSLARLEENVESLRELTASDVSEIKKDIERVKKFAFAAVLVLAATGGHENISKLLTFFGG